MSELDDLAYLWDGSDPGWCLVQLDATKPLGTGALAIYNRNASHALIIEDDKIYAQVIERMLAGGCAVVTATDMSGPDAGDPPGTAI